MKTNGAAFPIHPAEPKTFFGELFKKSRLPGQLASPPPLPLANRKGSPVGVAVPPGLTPKVADTVAQSAHQKTTATLTSARASAHQGVANLQQVRVSHDLNAAERLEGRFLDMICKELTAELGPDAVKVRAGNQDLPPVLALAGAAHTGKMAGGAEATRPVDNAVRAAQAVELIEKIEVFVKSSRTPALALTLNNSLGARVEIERIGPREVALKVVGHRGPPPPEDISRIREEMAARGLKVSALSVA